MPGAQKTVELVVKARDESAQVWRNARNGLNGFVTAQQRAASFRGLLQNQRETATAATQAAKALRSVGLAASTDQVRGFKAAREAARRAKEEVQAYRVAMAASRAPASAMPALPQAGRFAAFDAVASGATRAEAGIETLTTATVRNTAAAGANAAALRRQGAAMAGQGRGGFLGLRPYELQNLSYQINDVFTQIASGTPVMQVAAQQGGQFAQLFPKVVAGVIRFLPVIGLVTLALSPFISSLMKANEEAATLKEFDLLLTRSGNAAAYSAPKLAALAAALDQYDGSLAGARAAVTEFVGDAVAPEYLERFGKAALDLAKVMKMDVAEAAKTVSDAFTGNADAILALDDQLGFLTVEERKHAETLRKQRRDAELRTQAFAAFERQYGETAAKMRGPWSQILNDFGAAWNAFAEMVNLIDFKEASEKIDGLVKRIQRLTAMLPGARTANTPNAEAYVDRATAARNEAVLNQGQVARDTDPNSAEGRIRRRAAQALVDRRERELRAAQASLAINQLRDGSDPLFGQPDTSAGDTTTRPPKPAYTAPRNSDGERLAKQRAEFLESLRQESVARQFQLSLIDMTERQTRVLTALEQARTRAAELGLELSAAQVKTIEDEVRAQYDAEQAARGRQLIEQASLELAQARGEIETEAAFVTRKLREEGLGVIEEIDAVTGDITVGVTAEAAAYSEVLRNLYRINEATRQRAAAEKQVTDMTSLRSDLQNRATFLRDTGRGAEADAILVQIEGVNAQIVAAASNAIAMWAAIGGPEAEAAIAVLQTTRDEAQGLASDMIVSGRQINEMLADGGADAIGQFAQSIGEGVNAVQALGDAFRSFAADFLRQIAQMIAKQAVLNLLQAIGGSGGGGKGGDVGSAVASLVNSLFKHSGGTVAEGGTRRMVPLSAFANARRFHTGGMPGLKRNEVPTITEDTEGIFTKGQMAALAPVGKSGGSVKIVNVFDPAEALANALATEAGERVLLNYIRSNSGAFRAAIS